MNREWKTLVDMTRQRAADRPDQEAISFLAPGRWDPEVLTYRELDQKAREIAAHLQTVGKEGDRAMVACLNGLDYVTSLCGILYAGMVAIPSFPSTRDQDLSFFTTVCRDADVRAVLTTRHSLSGTEQMVSALMDGHRPQVVPVDDPAAMNSGTWREPQIAGTSGAMLQYTSGSTSVPKGIFRTHQNVLRGTAIYVPHLRCGPGSRLVNWMALHFGFALYMAVIRPLFGGFPATLMSPDDVMERPIRWLEAMSRLRATHSLASNFAYDLAARNVTDDEMQGVDLSSWEVAINGGEPIRAETLRRFADTFAPYGFRLDSFRPNFGMSEAIGVSFTPGAPVIRTYSSDALEAGKAVETSDEPARSLVSCGHVMSGVTVRIVDPQSRTVCNEGEVGELWVAGPTLADGYWERPEETKYTFQAHLANGEGPFVRSGDLAFFDGPELFVAGRIKEVIIIRGRNLYPQDIELAVEHSHPSVRPGSSAAFSVDAEGEEQLVVVTEAASDAPLQDIAAAVRQEVAKHHNVQVHRLAIVGSGQVPRTASGKIQRGACRTALLNDRLDVLFESVPTDMQAFTSYQPPVTPREKVLAATWQQVLGRERIGVTDNFFELGGDSLLSLRAMALARQKGLSFSVQQLLAHPTIQQLASVAVEGADVFTEQGLVTGPTDLLPQQRSLLEEDVNPIRFSGVTLIKVDQEPDRQAFAEALSATLRHHDGLRSRFIRSSDGWRAYIAPSEEHDIVEVHDISGLTPEKEILTARRIGDAVQKSLDLESGPLVRAALLSRGPNRPGMVLIGMHHLVTDVLSAQIFMEDLETAYGQLSRGEHVSLPSKTSSVQEWARKLTEYASSEAVQGELAYWLTPAHAEVGKLPVDFESEATMDTLRTVRLRMPAEDTQLMFRAVAAMSGTDVQDVLITGLAQALAEWTGTSSVALDIHTHGREDLFAGVDVSRTIGWFTVIFPMLLDLRGVATPLDALAAVKHQLRQVPRRGIGYDVLRYMSPDQQVRSLMSAVPRPQVRFNYVTRLSGVNRQGRIFSTIGPVRGPQLEQKASAYRLLEVSTSMARDHFTVDIQYSAAVHSEQTAARVGWMYLRALKQLTESALQPVI